MAAMEAGPSFIATTDFPTGPTQSFVPTGEPGNDGRGVLVLGNKVYYTYLKNGSGFTDFIHAAPFNGGKGGADNPAWALPNARPACGVQDLAYHDGYIYALTGYLDPFILFPHLLMRCKRPADHAFLVAFAHEMVCPLIGELRGTHDDGYDSSWS
jgi:hypothetical protein